MDCRPSVDCPAICRCSATVEQTEPSRSIAAGGAGGEKASRVSLAPDDFSKPLRADVRA